MDEGADKQTQINGRTDFPFLDSAQNVTQGIIFFPCKISI